DALGPLGAAAAEGLAGREDLGQTVYEPGVGEVQVEESRPGNLDAGQTIAESLAQGRPETLGDIARGRPEAWRQEQGCVRRVVAELRLRRPVEARGTSAVGELTGRLADGVVQLGERAHADATVSCRGRKRRSSRSR